MSVEYRASGIRITVGLFATLAVAFIALAARCFYLQYVRDEYYSGVVRQAAANRCDYIASARRYS